VVWWNDIDESSKQRILWVETCTKALQVRGAKWLTKCHMPGQVRGGATLLMNID
jgi:hypothetical protein